jgi:hypothetical protein
MCHKIYTYHLDQFTKYNFVTYIILDMDKLIDK